MTALSCLPPICGPNTTIDQWRARRRELIDLLSREEYGFTPPAPECVRAEILSSERGFAGKGIHSKIRLSFDTPKGEFSFPIDLVTPEHAESVPAFVLINFRPEVPDKYLPSEEILDHGFAVASFCYTTVTSDGPEQDGLAAMFPADENTGWGKIGIWAYAASRVMDYLLTLSEIDPARVAVIGHSRLGKTALWCGAQDERFCMTISNDSGCSVAALSRGKVGESIEAITRTFPFWFCKNYASWANREYEAPFDQHMLLALIAPRALYVASAAEDTWADPDSEHLCAEISKEAWRIHKIPPLVGYHVRPGAHYLSRTDWAKYMEYRKEKDV